MKCSVEPLEEAVIVLKIALKSKSCFYSSYSLRLALISATLVLLSAILILAYCLVGWSRLSSVSKSLNQLVSFAINVNTMYSAFVEERVTVA